MKRRLSVKITVLRPGKHGDDTAPLLVINILEMYQETQAIIYPNIIMVYD